MDQVIYDTVILSDLHLGSETSRAREALAALKSMRFRRLILLGDIFCDLNFRRLRKEHWEFLSFIRKLSNPKRNVEVVWVEGNHDFGLVEVMSHLVGIRAYDEYLWHFEGERHLAIHGHQFDSFVLKDQFRLSSLGGLLFLFIQKLDSKKKRFARFLDRLNTRWLRLEEKVANGALAHAAARDVKRVFCGHTHEPATANRQGIHYYNTGCWTTERPTYITVCEQGIKIHEYVDGVSYCFANEERREPTPAVAHAASDAPADMGYEGAYC
ncbi:MAG TPA: UDP-2,3-diacylglucosamine diphosphatase [Terriglobales bacterium]|nr:UDP-2,3-diacylglucosamine diphosphatase [Terriglobales bacterium]